MPMHAPSEIEASDLDAARRFLLAGRDENPAAPALRPARPARDTRGFVSVSHGINRARIRSAARGSSAAGE